MASNCTWPCNASPLSHDQALRWSLSHCCGGNVVSIHKLHFMRSILWNLHNKFFLAPIQSCNQKWMCNNNPQHWVHLGSSPWLGCFPTWHGECFQFNVKRGRISKTSCYKWGHHIIHSLCLCILCNWMSLVLYSLWLWGWCHETIPSIMGTHQGDPLGKALFVLTHFKALRFTVNWFFFCLYLSIIDGIRIISDPSITSSTYEHF